MKYNKIAELEESGVYDLSNFVFTRFKKLRGKLVVTKTREGESTNEIQRIEKDGIKKSLLNKFLEEVTLPNDEKLAIQSIHDFVAQERCPLFFGLDAIVTYLNQKGLINGSIGKNGSLPEKIMFFGKRHIYCLSNGLFEKQ